MTRLKQRTAVPSDTRTTRNTFAAHSGTSEAVFRSDGHVRSGDLAFAPLFRPTLQRLYVLNTSTYLKVSCFFEKDTHTERSQWSPAKCWANFDQNSEIRCKWTRVTRSTITMSWSCFVVRGRSREKRNQRRNGERTSGITVNWPSCDYWQCGCCSQTKSY